MGTELIPSPKDPHEIAVRHVTKLKTLFIQMSLMTRGQI